MTDDDFAAILTKSRENNQTNGLTGALLYRSGRFVQILEGPDAEVERWFDIIEADPRHHSVQKISEKTILYRQFPQWTMGFRPVRDGSAQNLDGFDDFFSRRGLSRLQHAENEAQQFLEWLGEYWLAER